MTQERKTFCINGWVALFVHLVLIDLFFQYCKNHYAPSSIGNWLDWSAPVSILVIGTLILAVRGYFNLFPNTAKVMTFFGLYAGTVRDTGFLWTNPFFERRTVSLRLRSVQGPVLKVNDKQANPIEISAVMIYHVEDTAQARFDVDKFDEYVAIQSESSLRHIATQYAYDHDDGQELTLRAGADAISHALQSELQARLSKAGVKVDEARITHLAYAPEIAMAMLRRQQATAVIAARRQIVEGAVSIVSTALDELNSRHVVDLDNERKAAMVSNLLVVLCSESQVQPIINAGTLYD